jgi:hypothetical protein
MNNKSKTRKASVAGVVGLTAAGLAATVVLANDPADDRPDSKAVERHDPASVYHYNGPRTADAAEAWLESAPTYTGPRTADAAEAWLESGAAYTGPLSPDATERSLARLYEGCQVYSAGRSGTRPGCSPGERPLGVHPR